MAPKPIKSLTDLPGYVFAELDRLKGEARQRGHQFVDLGMGSPDTPVPAPIIDALVEAAQTPLNHSYPPFLGVPKFLESAANYMKKRFDVTVNPARNVIALSGSKEGLAQVAMAYCGPGDIALVPDIYYPVHARAALLNGAEIYYVPAPESNGFLPVLSDIPADILSRAKIFITNYPNNPTGAVASESFFPEAIAFAKKHNIVLVSDLAYSELCYDDYIPPSVLQYEGGMDVAVEFHSCSKSFSMAGMRMGFVVGNEEIIGTIAAYRSNVGYGTPTAIQHAAAFAFDNYEELVAPVRDRYKARRDAGVQAFRDIGWEIEAPKAAMYLWSRIPEGFTEWEWTIALLEKANLVVTPGIAFGPGGNGYFRISLVADEKILADAIRRIENVYKVGTVSATATAS